jgi:hypothetical protein
MERKKISEMPDGDKLLRPIIKGKIAAWTVIALPASFSVSVLTDPNSCEIDEFNGWVQLPAESIKKACAEGKDYLELGGPAIFEDGTKLRILSPQECENLRSSKGGSYSKDKFTIKLLDLFVTEEDLKLVQQHPSWLSGSLKPRKKRKEGFENEVLVKEALDNLLKEFNYKRTDPDFKVIFGKKDISIPKLFDLISQNDSAYGLKENKGSGKIDPKSKRAAKTFKWEWKISTRTIQNILTRFKKDGTLEEILGKKP